MSAISLGKRLIYLANPVKTQSQPKVAVVALSTLVTVATGALSVAGLTLVGAAHAHADESAVLHAHVSAGVDVIASPNNTLPDQMDFTYTVSRGNIELGEILSSLKKAGENYQSVTTTRPNSLIKMLGADDIRQETEFALTANGFSSVSYLESRSDRPTRRVDFDGSSGLIHFSVDASGNDDKDDKDGQTAQPLTRVEKSPDYDTIDIGSLPFYLMTKPIFELSGNHLGIVTGKKIGHYKIEQPVAELMQTPLGELKTWRIENQPIKTPPEAFPATAGWSGMGISTDIETSSGNHEVVGDDKDDRSQKPKDATSIIVWLSPAHNNLPVKIVKRKGKRETTLLLASINGRDIVSQESNEK